LLVGVAVLTSQVESVLNAAFALSGLTSGAMLGGLMLTLLWRQGRATPVVTGMLTALVVMAALHSLPRMAWSQAWWNETVGVVVFWPWYTLIGTVITLAVAGLTRAVLGGKKAR
jgi:Na+/proline symporter